jgi:hypothetical protein
MWRGLSGLIRLNRAPAAAPTSPDSANGGRDASTPRRIGTAAASAPLRRSPRNLGAPRAGGDTGLNQVYFILFYFIFLLIFHAFLLCLRNLYLKRMWREQITSVSKLQTVKALLNAGMINPATLKGAPAST